MIKRRLLALVCVAIMGAVAMESGCSGGGGSGLASCGSDPLFSVSPVSVDRIKAFVPLGRLNPTGHTMPTRHMYLYLTPVSNTDSTVASTNLRAPGAMRIKSVSAGTITSNDPPTTDYSIYFDVCGEVSGNFGHVATLSSEIESLVGGFSNASCSTYTTGGDTIRSCSKSISLTVSAGDVIGTAGGEGNSIGVDFVLRDTRTTLTFANSDRVLSDMPNVVCAYDYYDSSMQSQLSPLLADDSGTFQRTQAPLCGTIDVDISGTAQGMWFSDTTSTLNDGEDEHLALAPHNVKSGVQVFSIGNAVSTITAKPYEFTATSSGSVNRDFGDVTANGTTYCYDVTDTEELPSVFLLKLTSDTTLQIEGIDDASCGSGPWSFTGNQTTLYR